MKALLVLSFFLLAACASQPKSQPAIKIPAPVLVEDNTSLEPPIDLDRLQTHLQLDRAPESLGYSEKRFATCEVGFGYPSNRNCRQDYFVLIHFQLMCRESSQETHYAALGSSDMRALNGSKVKWNLNRSSGTLNLDDRGFGQIRTTATSSLKQQRLKINIGNENLYMRAGDINRVVTPADWCR